MAFHNFFPGAVKRIAGKEFVLGVPDAETGFYPLLVNGAVVMTVQGRTLMDLTGGVADSFPRPVGARYFILGAATL